MSCIILIDLQNDFNKIISPLMIYSIRKICKNTSLKIFWVYSNYFESESTDDPFSLTHSGKKKLCIKDTEGAKISKYFDDIKIESDNLILKKHYSAFYNTNLKEILDENKITEIYLGGVTINCCIQRTAEHAKYFGLTVNLLTDCSNGFSLKKNYEWFFENAILKTKDDVIDVKAMIVYYVNGSIPSWRVVMLMNYLGIHFTINRLKVMNGETKSPEFLTINKRGLTPTVIDDDLTLTESHAILQYLIKFYSDGDLIGETKKEYSNIMSIVFMCDDIRKKYNPLEIFFKNTDKLTEDKINRAHEAYMNVHKEYKLIEESLDTIYIADDKLTLADFSFYPTLSYHVHRGFEIEKYPKLQKYYEMLSKEHFAIFSCPAGWRKTNNFTLSIGKINVFSLALSEKERILSLMVDEKLKLI